ncbi:MAG: dUTP diphosphatase [Nanoarchaeota archaeon]
MEQQELQVKIKKLHPNAKIPHYANFGDAGMDIYAISKEENEKYISYKTGLSFELPQGHVMLIFPRSSLSKKDLVLANSVGVLDSGYRGELECRFKKIGNKNEIYNIGEKIGQIIILPFPKINFQEVEKLDESLDRGGGFGSTGN